MSTDCRNSAVFSSVFNGEIGTVTDVLYLGAVILGALTLWREFRGIVTLEKAA